MKIKFCCKAPNLKLTKKLALIASAVLAAILAVGIIVCAVCGFNNSVNSSNKDTKNIVVSVDSYYYEVDGGNINKSVNEVFGLAGVEADDVNVGNRTSGVDVVYVFDKDTNTEVLNAVKDALNIKLSAEFPDAIVSVAFENVRVIGTQAKDYVARGLIALLVFAVASLLYVWIRYKLFAALYMLGGNLLTLGVTTALSFGTPWSRTLNSPKTIPV